MIANAFTGKARQPTDSEVAAELGPAKANWDRLLTGLAQDCDLTTREWNSSSRKAGWSLRLKRGDRKIVYLSPGHGVFMASFALGDRAVQEAHRSKLPQEVIEIIDTAKHYAEGTAVRLEVKRPQDIAAVIQLAAIKLAN